MKIFRAGISQYNSEVATGDILQKKVLLKSSQNSQENTCVVVFCVADLQACNFIIKRLQPPTQVFSCEICKIFKNIYFQGHLQTTASNNSGQLLLKNQMNLIKCY